jgi:hypothetical protein
MRHRSPIKCKTVLPILVLAAIVFACIPQVVTCAAASHRPTPAAVRTATRDILARPEFGVRQDSWREAAAKAEARALEKAFRWLGGKLDPHIAESSVFVGAVVVLLILGVALLILLLLLRLKNRHVIHARNSETTSSVSYTSASPSELAGEALAKAAKGDFASAFRLGFLAVLLALDRSGDIRYHMSKTNWEYVRALRSAGRVDLSDDLETLSRTFDFTQYGSQPCSAADYESCISVYQRVSAGDGRPE